MNQEEPNGGEADRSRTKAQRETTSTFVPERTAEEGGGAGGDGDNEQNPRR